MKYSKGEVVVVLFPFSEIPKAKNRPAVIIGTKANEYVVCKITHAKPIRGELNKFVGLTTPTGMQMGIKSDSYVVYDSLATLEEKDIRFKIGDCPFIDEISDNYCDLKGPSSLDS